MSRSAKVSVVWGGERRAFRLGIDELDELDDLCKVGPGHLLALVSGGVSGNWKARQLRETLRLGLVGGGMAPAAALALIERYFDKERAPLSESLVVVQVVLMACVVGDEGDEKPGEPNGRDAEPLPDGRIRFGAIYEVAGAIGVADVGRLSLWQFNRLYAGWRRANCPEDKAAGALSDAERAQLEAMLDNYS